MTILFTGRYTLVSLAHRATVHIDNRTNTLTNECTCSGNPLCDLYQLSKWYIDLYQFTLSINYIITDNVYIVYGYCEYYRCSICEVRAPMCMCARTRTGAYVARQTQTGDTI